jgi:hypothetical protein
VGDEATRRVLWYLVPGTDPERMAMDMVIVRVGVYFKITAVLNFVMIDVKTKMNVFLSQMKACNHDDNRTLMTH